MHAAQCIPDIPRATQHVQPLQAINVVGRSIVEHLAQRCGEILRIRGGAGTLVTAIELLSPANKRPGVNGADAYEQKRQEIFDSTVNLLEIDLLRNGRRPQVTRPLPDAPYFVFLSRVQRRPYSEIWSLSLREPIKLLPVPLLYPAPPLKCRLFRRIALECGQWDRQRLPLQCSIFRIGTGCGRAEARPYHKKPTPESPAPPRLI
jgi:hypothetical protein